MNITTTTKKTNYFSERLSVVCVIAALLEGADANVSAAHNPPFVLFELNEDL